MKNIKNYNENNSKNKNINNLNQYKSNLNYNNTNNNYNNDNLDIRLELNNGLWILFYKTAKPEKGIYCSTIMKYKLIEW